MNFLNELRRRNPLLYWFGWYNLLVGIICLLLIFFDDTQLLGVSRWVKPMKFFLSVALMVWTMGWLLHYLDAKKKIRFISWVIVVSMFIENAVIMLQSARGQQSHYNVTSALNGILFSIMGVFILIFTLGIIYAIVLYFRQKTFSIPEDYLWGIRLGLILFLIFSVEGGLMISQLSHTIGAKDGSPGLPLVNWSTDYGDLRIAHFIGMHALQVLPLSAHLIFKTKKQVMIFAAVYFILALLILVQALRGQPLVG